MSSPPPQAGSDQICFGLNRETDERSIAIFLRLFVQDELLAALIPRLGDAEIMLLVDRLTGTLRSHLSEQEYHELFLGDRGHGQLPDSSQDVRRRARGSMPPTP